jgi:hydrogenase/urease accessory protein HupE
VAGSKLEFVQQAHGQGGSSRPTGAPVKRNLSALTSVVAVAGCLSCATAEAHLNSTGMGPLYDGLAHFYTSPEDMAPVIALGLFAGLRGVESARRALLILPVSWFLGCLVGVLAPYPVRWPVAAISFLVFGGLLAADARVSVRWIGLLCALLGLVHGAMNGAGVPWSGSVVVSYVGLAGGISVLFALVSALVVRLQRPWMRVAVRVLGSWIVATGFLLLGWAARSA